MRLLTLFTLIFIACGSAQAQTIIRDTEIETTLREWSTPIFQAAGLSPNDVNIILVQNPRVNAFVAGGANIFLFTGLIDRAENPEEIIGVIAHETGHISGGHLISLRSSVEQASYETIIGTVLGIGAAILTGEGAAAGAIISGSQNVATRRFLAHSRLNESSADQAALSFLDRAEINPEGLLSFMEKLEGDELLPPSQQAEYIRTHPLTGNRINALRTNVEDSPHKGRNTPSKWNDQYARMKAKLDGFIQPQQVAFAYNSNDRSIPSRYARAIAAFKQNNLNEALRLLDGLIQAEPKNPYFQELKGQMLVESGRVQEALKYYKQSVSLLPNAPLIRIAYAHALIESAGQNNKEILRNAIQHLQKAEVRERRSARLHRLLATAHGRLGEETEARLHLAEEAVLQKRFKDAKRFAGYTKKQAPAGSRAALRAADILKFIDQNGKN